MADNKRKPRGTSDRDRDEASDDVRTDGDGAGAGAASEPDAADVRARGRSRKRGRHGVRESGPSLNVYLASALFQRARYQKLTQDARNGPEFIVQVYDTCARMVLLVEDQLRHGSNGPVQVNALPAEPAEGDKTDGKP